MTTIEISTHSHLFASCKMYTNMLFDNMEEDDYTPLAVLGRLFPRTEGEESICKLLNGKPHFNKNFLNYLKPVMSGNASSSLPLSALPVLTSDDWSLIAQIRIDDITRLRSSNSQGFGALSSRAYAHIWQLICIVVFENIAPMHRWVEHVLNITDPTVRGETLRYIYIIGSWFARKTVMKAMQLHGRKINTQHCNNENETSAVYSCEPCGTVSWDTEFPQGLDNMRHVGYLQTLSLTLPSIMRVASISLEQYEKPTYTQVYQTLVFGRNVSKSITWKPHTAQAAIDMLLETGGIFERSSATICESANLCFYDRAHVEQELNSRFVLNVRQYVLRNKRNPDPDDRLYFTIFIDRALPANPQLIAVRSELRIKIFFHEGRMTINMDELDTYIGVDAWARAIGHTHVPINSFFTASDMMKSLPDLALHNIAFTIGVVPETNGEPERVSRLQERSWQQYDLLMRSIYN